MRGLSVSLGLGAQTLINDIVSGFFILFENYYLVGDYIEAGKAEDKVVEGTVEAIELRTTASDILMVNYKLFAMVIWVQLPIIPNNMFLQ